MWPFFLEQSGGRATSLPQQDNELPKRWKVTLPTLELKGSVGAGKRRGEWWWRRDLIHIKWSGDGRHSVSSCTGCRSTTKRVTWDVLCLYRVYWFIPAASAWLPSASPPADRKQRKTADQSTRPLRPFQTPPEANAGPMPLEASSSPKKNTFPCEDSGIYLGHLIKEPKTSHLGWCRRGRSSKNIVQDCQR